MCNLISNCSSSSHDDSIDSEITNERNPQHQHQQHHPQYYNNDSLQNLTTTTPATTTLQQHQNQQHQNQQPQNKQPQQQKQQKPSFPKRNNTIDIKKIHNNNLHHPQQLKLSLSDQNLNLSYRRSSTSSTIQWKNTSRRRKNT
mmetsp:Transcript_43338/g.91015  ORF Transcript_43338/g.91015 Transcript_43338/m.91015 type:complete len:143 (-) Transcript_43338:498-926(-)